MIIQIIILVVLLAVLGFAVLAAMQPTTFTITRSATFSAPPEKVFVQINTLPYWDAWSPWAKLDPEATNTFSGPEAGVGAAMGWSGNHKVGVGKMTITESRPYEYISFRLEFIKPFQATNTSEFTFSYANNMTTVHWSMHGNNNFMARVMGLLMNCDKMVGGQFEQGLATLKTLVETGEQDQPSNG